MFGEGYFCFEVHSFVTFMAIQNNRTFEEDHLVGWPVPAVAGDHRDDCLAT